MATCKDCIHDKLCVIKAFPDAFENTEWSKKPCDHFKPTADVAPKTEVAREIFEEIKTCLEYEYMSYLKAYDYTLLTRIEELEEKYTEDQNNENDGQDHGREYRIYDEQAVPYA